jgi:hypothetical protein
MSAGCGDGEPEVLEVLGDGAAVRRLTETGAAEALDPEALARGAGPHPPHHLTGPPADTPAGSWGEALQRWGDALLEAARGGGGGGGAAQPPEQPQRRPEPTPS